MHRLTLNSGADGGRYELDMALFSKLSNDLWQGDSESLWLPAKGIRPSFLSFAVAVTNWLLPPAVISLHWRLLLAVNSSAFCRYFHAASNIVTTGWFVHLHTQEKLRAEEIPPDLHTPALHVQIRR